MNKRTKRRLIHELLKREMSPEQIALEVDCALSYVYATSRNYVPEYRRSVPVKMVIGPWARDAQGNFSREIRGT